MAAGAAARTAGRDGSARVGRRGCKRRAASGMVTIVPHNHGGEGSGNARSSGMLSAMSDEPTPMDAAPLPPEPEPPTAPVGEAIVRRPIEGAPLGFVHLGTGTDASKRLFERRYREAERRRAEADQAAALARNAVDVRYEDPQGERAVTKLPGRDGGAVQYTTQFTEHPEIPKAYIHLIYLDRMGAETGLECLADLIVGANPARPTELCLILVCPGCTKDTHKHAQDNQLRIFQSNKYFDFRASMGPKTISFRDPETDEVKIYPSAGMVMESEPFRCPDCGWRARIVQNRLRPD